MMTLTISLISQTECYGQWGSARQVSKPLSQPVISSQNSFNASYSNNLGTARNGQSALQPVGRLNAGSNLQDNRLANPSASLPSTGGFPAATSTPAANSTAVQPIYWGSHGLAIPYRWAGQLGNRGAKEVVLYVSQQISVGGDANWQKVSSASPQVHSFQYQAPGDGEYYFAIRTYDRFGSHQPAGPLQAEMHVIVDTTSPRNPLVTTEIRDGILTAKVVLNDSAEIDPQSLRLYAQAPNQPNWAPIQLEPFADNSIVPGQVAAIGRWRLPLGANQASIRASIADKAGNRSETNANATVRGSLAGSSLATSSATTQFASNPYGLAPPASSRFSAQTSSTQAALVSRQDPFAAANQQHGLREPFAAASPATNWNTDRQSARSQEASSSAFNSSRPFAASSTASGQPLSANQLSSPSQPWPVDSARTKPFVAQQRPQSSNNNPNNPFQSASFGSTQVRSNLPARNQASPSATNRMVTIGRSVNSTSFEFDYELDKTGKWGVANVELWGTTDGGNSWRRFAIDSDRLSPIHVNVPGEGDYGFKILVESVGGFEPTPPRPGEEPEVMVRVDQTAPRVMIQRAEQGQGYQADRLDIQWSAMEEYPVERPIDLFYSNRASGPWIPLATSLDNSGRYAWRIQRHLPKQVYLKIEARDEAGNVGSTVTPEMISITVPQTTGSLRGIRTAPGVGY